MTYVLDTNTISYFIQGNRRIYERLREATGRHEIVIPPVAYYEIKRGFLYKPVAGKEKEFERLCRLYPIGETGLDVWERAAHIYADIRRSGRTVEDADILIAAFCIVNDCTLVTNNTKHFEGIDGLRLEDWTAQL
jgi:tRNA(fMet)-specific endonuclease VapC